MKKNNMENTKLTFGVRGIWHRPASEETHAKDIPAVVLEYLPQGLIYIFTLDKGVRYLTGRTATIPPEDFTIEEPKREWYIWSIEHGAWWAMDRNGYVEEYKNAGLYTYEEALGVVKDANILLKDEPNEAMIKVK